MVFPFVCFLSMVMAMSPPPIAVVDLDLAPQLRWTAAVHAVLSAHAFEHSFGPVFASHNASLFTNVSDTVMKSLAVTVERFWPEQAKELQGISTAFQQAGQVVTYEYLCAWVYFHELAHTSPLAAQLQSPPSGCTALLVSDKNGNIVHARNMDQTPPAARNCTLEITFKRGGKVLFVAVDWYWFTTGVMTAMKPGVVSVQENWRFQHMDYEHMLVQLRNGVLPQVFVFRHILSTATSFDEVVGFCQTVPLAAPFYVAVGGVRSGAVITRSASSYNSTLHLNNASQWFLVQTNYDHWKPDPTDDPRRTVATEKVRELGQTRAATQLGTYAVVSTYPVHNEDTAYTAIMHVASGELHAFVRQALIPAV